MKTSYADTQKQEFLKQEALHNRYKQIADHCKYVIVQTSARRYSVLKIKYTYSFSPVSFQNNTLHCVPLYEVYASRLTYDDAVQSAIELNRENGVNPLVDENEFNKIANPLITAKW